MTGARRSWPEHGLVVPAEAGRFDVYALHYQVREVGEGAMVVVGSHYQGPVVAWRIATSMVEDGYFVCSPISPGIARSRDDYPGRVNEKSDRVGYFWHDTKTDHFYTLSASPFHRDDWSDLCREAVNSHSDGFDHQREREGLDWLVPNPPDGSYGYQDAMLLSRSR